MIIIVIPILIAVLLGVEELLYRKYWDKNLGVSLQFDEAPVTEGDKTTLTEVVTNGKRMPVPVLEVGFSIDRGSISRMRETPSFPISRMRSRSSASAEMRR